MTSKDLYLADWYYYTCSKQTVFCQSNQYEDAPYLFMYSLYMLFHNLYFHDDKIMERGERNRLEKLIFFRSHMIYLSSLLLIRIATFNPSSRVHHDWARRMNIVSLSSFVLTTSGVKHGSKHSRDNCQLVQQSRVGS